MDHELMTIQNWTVDLRGLGRQERVATLEALRRSKKTRAEGSVRGMDMITGGRYIEPPTCRLS